MEGYIIIAPYRCDDPQRPFRALSDIPLSILDEVLFYEIWSQIFTEKNMDKNSSMSFQHGRAGRGSHIPAIPSTVIMHIYVVILLVYLCGKK